MSEKSAHKYIRGRDRERAVRREGGREGGSNGGSARARKKEGGRGEG
jgi:hypothetical protein